MSLPECENESLNAGIKELDLKTPVLYLLLAYDYTDEAVEPGQAVRAESDPQLSAGALPSNVTLKRTDLLSMATGYLTFKLRTASSTFLRFFQKRTPAYARR